MANFLVGAGDKVSVLVKAIPAGTQSPTPGGDPDKRLLGGTQAGFNISAEQTDSTVFEDDLGYSLGVVTSQSWDIPWTGNLLNSDIAHDIVKNAAVKAVLGEKVGITVTVKDAAQTVISQLVGIALVTNYSEDYPADGILTYNCTFTGYGTPTLS
jgi:hypothetical protein